MNVRRAKERITQAVDSKKTRQFFRTKTGEVIDGEIVGVIDKPTVLVREPSGKQVGIVLESIEEMVDADLLDKDIERMRRG